MASRYSYEEEGLRQAIIVNPIAGRGQARDIRDLVVRAFGRLGETIVFETTAVGDEERVAAEAIAASCNPLVVVGGDGTCARVARVILERRIDCSLAVVPAGTGNDFAKSLGVAHYTPGQSVALVAVANPVRIDVGLADGDHFINTCGFGFDASVLKATQNVRFLKGDAVYIYSALRQLFSYRGIEIATGGALRRESERMLMAVASNGRSLGGAFRIAPTASVIDGKLDFCFFGDTNVLGRARRFAAALRGTHLTLPGVTGVKADTLTLTFAEKPAMEMDGELRLASSRTVRIECVPRALSVYAAPGALV